MFGSGAGYKYKSTPNERPILEQLGWPLYNDNLVLCKDCSKCAVCGVSFINRKLAFKRDGRIMCQTCSVLLNNGKRLSEIERESKVKEIMTSSIPNPFDGFLLLDAGERIHDICDCEIVSGEMQANGVGKFILTNKKVVYMDENTKMSPLKAVDRFILPYDSIEGIELEYLEGYAFLKFLMQNKRVMQMLPDLSTKDYDKKTLVKAVVKIRESISDPARST
jgi:uncharacterized Zn finger protein (UPF0148 family)